MRTAARCVQHAAIVCLAALWGFACARAPKPATPGPASATSRAELALVPFPAALERGAGSFTITPKTVLHVGAQDPAIQRAARQLAELIRRSTGIAVPVTSQPGATAEETIAVRLDEQQKGLGPEGYELTIAPQSVSLTAATPAGLFYGVQTIRQLLPYASEYDAVLYEKPRPATLPALHLRDQPRYEWRGAMLDVARHFFSVEDVERYVDLLALHKMNRLHLHLADDQGWRIEIRKWPDLTLKGGASEVGGGPGGFYTQAQYAQLVAYAADRFVTIVPEIDMPGHTNAALSSYAELNCNGAAASPRFDTEVGYSSVCVDKDVTYRFIDDVVGEIAGMTPGPYFHAGGDEVKTLTPAQYKAFVERVQTSVQSHGKQMIGWDEIAATSLLPTSIVQHWRPDASKAELSRAPKLILSPGDRAYLDMKYDDDTALGLKWAALIPIQRAYDWDPAALVPGTGPAAILGVEAPLWSETVTNMREVEFLAFPRLAAIAEIGWSPQARRSWDGFRVRLGGQAPRWTALGINFYRAPEIPWVR
jgi:hexosaminidase